MTGNTERHEQARQYFVACEQGLKVAIQKLQSTNDITQITESLSTLTQALTKYMKIIVMKTICVKMNVIP